MALKFKIGDRVKVRRQENIIYNMNEPISIKEHNEGRSGIVIGITDKIINNIAVEFYKYTSGHNFHGYDFKILKPHGWFFMEKELDFLYNWIEL